MRSDPLNISLLSYLDAGEAKFRLEITQIPRQDVPVGTAFPPFLIVGNAGPTACLISAGIITDSGNLLKKVFILKQKDEYRLHSDEIWPFTNINIDQGWQEAVARYSAEQHAKKSRANAPLLLKDQIDGSGRLLRFQPLFYCIYRDVYFHPPCPHCGHDLQLCEDDQLLITSELKAYSTSLNRYLYCSECHRHRGQTAFYSVRRDPSDPAHLKDQLQLISDFGQLVLNTSDAEHFPCIACQEKSKCYGPDNLVLKRIVPFGFYPFYGLAFEAATLHALDFLMLLSGATPDELRRRLLQKRELGRLSLLDAFCSQAAGPPSGLFAADHPKRFLEILYLKLSFLGELLQMAAAGGAAPTGFAVPFTIEDVWVTLPDHSSRLPGFWNFKLSIMDSGIQAGSPGRLSKYPPAYSHHFLGIVWFYVLLVNKRQPMEKVRAAIEQVMADVRSSGQSFSKASQTNNRPELAPANIFWDPDAKSIEAGWQRFWEKSIDLGVELLAAGGEQETAWPGNRFWPVLELLRKEIVDELLGRPDIRAPRRTATDDQAIAAILLKLQQKWRAALKTATDAQDLDETITLSTAEKTAIESARPAFDRQAGPPTVVMAADEDGNRKPPGKAAADEEETLLLSPDAYPASKNAHTGMEDEGIVQETIVLSSKDLLKFNSTAEAPPPDSEEKDLGATVVVSPARNSKIKPAFASGAGGASAKDSEPNQKAAIHQENDDILTETVVLRPKKEKNE